MDLIIVDVSKVKNNTRVKANQILVLKTPPDDLASLLETFDFSIPEELHFFKEDDLEEIEVMITPGSRLIGRKHDFFYKIAYEELNLLGLWRKGSKYRTRLTRETFRAGDVLLLGVKDLEEEDVTNKIKHLGLMPLRQRELQTIPSRSRLLKGMIFFAISIALVAFNYLTTAVKAAFSKYLINSRSFNALAFKDASLEIAFLRLLTIPSNLLSLAEAIAFK